MGTNSRIDVVLITEDRYIEPDNSSVYVTQIFYEDATIIEPLKKAGLSVKRVSWSSGFDFSAARVCVFRTPWDYFRRLPEFLNWFESVKGDSQFLNSNEIVRYNLDKHYLLDLEERGNKIIPTKICEKNSTTPLGVFFEILSSQTLVIKPTVSGAAYDTFKVENNKESEKLFSELLKKHAMMVQPFIPEIILQGEYSLIVIDGQCTHGVLKKAKRGDYRVQDDHGGTVIPIELNDSQKTYAESVIKNCGFEPLYARVDFVIHKGENLLMELEMIEPELFLRFHPEAGEVLAQALLNQIKAMR